MKIFLFLPFRARTAGVHHHTSNALFWPSRVLHTLEWGRREEGCMVERGREGWKTGKGEKMSEWGESPSLCDFVRGVVTPQSWRLGRPGPAQARVKHHRAA